MQETTTDNSIKLFDLYSYDNITVADITLAPFINIHRQQITPHTSATNAGKFRGQTNVSIVERFACYFMRRGRNNGKKMLALRAVNNAFFLIEKMSGKNPIQVLVDAIINSGPREESGRVGRGGAMKRTSVDVSSQRRVNKALYFLTKGMREKAYKNPKTLAEVVADELLLAESNSPNSYAVKKRDEVEKIAKSNR
ncbi:40S ribosomal protein S5a [Cucumispora dikerogammari]|nr:40S ribosomal protein S5a [Cucumispora dikerogammari]